MPKKGWKTITLKEELHSKLKETAQIKNTTVPEEIERLIKKELIDVDPEAREIMRSTLYQMATEIKASNSQASIQEIREWLKNMIDVSV